MIGHAIALVHFNWQLTNSISQDTYASINRCLFKRIFAPEVNLVKFDTQHFQEPPVVEFHDFQRLGFSPDPGEYFIFYPCPHITAPITCLKILLPHILKHQF